ncbi:MAG: septal ring lytic transglycosylase RlpA family protein [Rhizomicrobium sp.]
MRGAVQRVVFVAAFGALAAACSTGPDTSSASLPSGGGVYKIGDPYEEAGVWYTPRVQTEYDETGIASWYGPSFYGRRTANGELFDGDALTAAHPTLPMPVNVRVTDLENGRSLVLRVNDRGPFARGRIIDVSPRAAKLLGFYGKGTAKVRVTYLARADGSRGAPAEASSTVAAAAVAAPTAPVQIASLDPVTSAPPAEPLPPAAADSPPDPPADMPPVASSAHHLYVQAGAFADRDNAERLCDRLSAAGNLTISSIDTNGRLLYRVRIGPFDDIGAADAALARLTGLGGNGARIVVDH